MRDALFRPYEPLLPVSWAARGPLLVVAPHADDEVLGCGGLIWAHRQGGMPVHVAILTDGSGGNPGHVSGSDYIHQRQQESRAAGEILGGTEHHFLGYPDGALRDHPECTAELASVIGALKPSTVVFPSPFEVHPDHRAASLATMTALEARKFAGHMLCYEVGVPLPANLLLDITPAMDSKVAAAESFSSQLLHQDLIGKMRALHVARTVNVPDPAVRFVEAYTALTLGHLPGFAQRVDGLLLDLMAMTPRF